MKTIILNPTIGIIWQATPGFQKLMKRNMENVGRHTWISANKEMKHENMLFGKPESH